MTDTEIIRAILQGEKEKYRLLMEKYQPLVFRTCLGFVHYKDDADVKPKRRNILINKWELGCKTSFYQDDEMFSIEIH